jgi:hypothetical protein
MGRRQGPRAAPALWVWRSPARVVLAAALTSGLLHLMFVPADLEPDEGGYLEVARQWNVAGPSLYGHLWVDRPPGLLVLFHAADLLGPYGVRLLAVVAAVVLVLSAGWAGFAAGGGRAARWSAIVAAALGSSELLGAKELDGELLAAPLVMLSVALLLHAWGSWSRWWLRAAMAVASGGAAMYAVLVKQNFVDGLAFAGVLLLVHLLRRSAPRIEPVRLAGAFALGSLAVIGAVTGWAQQYGRLAELWYAMYGFRLDAMSVLDSGPLSAPELRLLELAGLGLLGGVVYLAVALLVELRRELRLGDPRVLAVTAGLAVEVVGVALGASYWPHYLIQTIPMIALGCGIAAARSDRGAARLRGLCVLAAATTLLATPALAVYEGVHGNDATRVGQWVGASARGHDSLVVAYSHPNVLQASGLTTPYPYAWSLPIRTLDPHLSRLGRLVSGPRAPTWIVAWDDLSSWELDPADRFATDVAHHYRVVGDICGHQVWLHQGISRRLAAPPTGCDPAFGEG